MKQLLVLVIVGVSMIFFACSDNNPVLSDMNQSDQGTNFLAKKPAAKLVGEMQLDFVLIASTEPGMEDVVWDGADIGKPGEQIGENFRAIVQTSDQGGLVGDDGTGFSH